MNRAAGVFGILLALTSSMAFKADAASLSKTYSHYAVGGATLEEIEAELARRGPKIGQSGARHPGATEIEFKTRVNYGERNGRCGVHDAYVSVRAKVILPRWKRNPRADPDTVLIWDTLAADIKRHEEYHVDVARNHARELENALKSIHGRNGCERAQDAVKSVTAEILGAHDRAQERFDRVESINFEDRLQRLIRYRIERLEAGR
jgi:predicted secreted Zn-dependent protease